MQNERYPIFPFVSSNFVFDVEVEDCAITTNKGEWILSQLYHDSNVFKSKKGTKIEHEQWT